jgi:hypothetical protein
MGEKVDSRRSCPRHRLESGPNVGATDVRAVVFCEPDQGFSSGVGVAAGCSVAVAEGGGAVGVSTGSSVPGVGEAQGVQVGISTGVSVGVGVGDGVRVAVGVGVGGSVTVGDGVVVGVSDTGGTGVHQMIVGGTVGSTTIRRGT